MDKHVVEVTRQCAYYGKKGRCRSITTITHPFCAKHTKKMLGLSVKPSKVKGAGYGLFAEKDFKKGQKIVEYTGEILTQDEYDERYLKDDMGSYGISLTEELVVDAARTDSGVARYACDFHGSGGMNNADYEDNGDTIWIVAVRKIKAGEEIYTDYGEDMHEALGLE